MKNRYQTMMLLQNELYVQVKINFNVLFLACEILPTRHTNEILNKLMSVTACSYFNNVMAKFMINNETDALKI